MKQIIVLAFFGLFMPVAFGQMVEINSPSEDDLYCALTWAPSDNQDNLIIYVFGENGTGYLSSDKCASWRKLEVDPKEKRSIFSALRVSDTLLIVSGDRNNNLLKYSPDGGETFFDFDFLADKYVSGVTLFNDYVIFSHQKSLTYWHIKSGKITEFTPLTNSFKGEIVNVSSSNFLINLLVKDTSQAEPSFFLLTNDCLQDDSWKQLDIGVDSVMSLMVKGNYSLVSLKQAQSVLEAVCQPFSDKLAVNSINGLKSGDLIKSSHVSFFSSSLWHVGINCESDEGLVVKSGEVVKRLSGGGFNGIYHCGYYDEKGYCNLVDDVIIVGDNGRLLSSRLDLSLARSQSLCSDYLVSDTIIYSGDKALIHVSGSDVGALYQVFAAGASQSVFKFVGNGSPWTFSVPVVCSNIFYISASKDGQSVVLSDMAEVETIIRRDYEVSDVSATLGQKVVITVSGSQPGLEYRLTSVNGKNIGIKSQLGTGNPIFFTIDLNSGLFSEGENKMSVAVRGCGFPVLLDDKSIVTIRSSGLSILGNNNLFVFPNPCQDVLIVNSNKQACAYFIDLSGRVLKSVKLEYGSNEIDMIDLKSGIYFVRVNNEVAKVIKQ